MHLIRTACLFLLLAAAPATAGLGDVLTPRIFDIVPPDGLDVQWVDGYTVLRQPGKPFGAVVSFIPESGLTAWVPVAVLNTSGEPMKVRQKDITARFGDTELKVYNNAAMVREYTQRRREMLAYSQDDAEGKSLDDLLAANRSLDQELGPGRNLNVGSSRRRIAGEPQRQEGSRDAAEAKALADAQLIALKERLFQDATIEPGKFNRGDVRVTLPPQRDDQPAEFVLTLDFGGKKLDVLFRERDGSRVEVGELEQAAAADQP